VQTFKIISKPGGEGIRFSLRRARLGKLRLFFCAVDRHDVGTGL